MSLFKLMEFCCDKCDYMSKYIGNFNRHKCKKPKNLEHKCTYQGCTYSSDHKHHLEQHLVRCNKNVINSITDNSIDNSIVINNIITFPDKILKDKETEESDEEIEISDKEIEISDEEIEVFKHVNSTNIIKKFQEYKRLELLNVFVIICYILF